MRIIVCHSPFVQCGVRQYGEQLDRALMLRVECPSFTYRELAGLVAASVPGDVVLFHFEPGAVLDQGGFATALEALKRKGVKTAFVCHWFDAGVLNHFKTVDLFILHRDYAGISDPRIRMIPHGCPVYEVSDARREELRRVRGWAGRTVVTTIGFLTGWKQTSVVTDTLLRQMRDPKVLIYAHGSPPLGQVAVADEGKLRLLEKRHGGRLVFCSEFLLEEQLLDLVAASDLGFVYHGVDSGSVSGATKQFVAARCPLVVTSSSHASDLKKGVSRVPSKDVFPFCREVVRLAGDAASRAHLRLEMEENYAALNWDVTADKFVDALSRLG